MTRIEKIDNEEAFAAIEKPWNALSEKSHSDNILFTHEWCAAWWKAFGGDKALYLLTIREGDELVGIVPLVQSAQKKMGRKFKIIAFLGSSEQRPFDIIGCGSRQLIDEVFDYLLHNKKDWSRIELPHLHSTSDLSALILDSLRSHNLKFRISPGMAVIESRVNYFDAQENGSPAIRILEDDLNYNLQEIADPKEIETHLPVLFQLDINCRNADLVPSKFNEPSIRRFYYELVRRMAPHKQIRLVRLSADEVPVAYGFNFVTHDKVRPHLTVINPLFGRRQPLELFKDMQAKLFARQGLRMIANVDMARKEAPDQFFDITVFRNRTSLLGAGRRDRLLKNEFLDSMFKSRDLKRRILKAQMVFQERGFWSMIGKSFFNQLQRIGQFIITYRIYYIYRHEGPVKRQTRVKVAIEIRKMGPADIDRIATFYGVTTRRQKYDTILKRFEKGADCYAALHHGYIVSMVWGLHHEDYHREFNLTLTPAKDEVVISDALTSTIYRSMGIAPYLLGVMVSDYHAAGIKAIAGVLNSNMPSRKGLEIYDFKHISNLRYLKIFGFRVI